MQNKIALLCSLAAALGVVAQHNDVVFCAVDGDIARDMLQPLKPPQPTERHILTPYPDVVPERGKQCGVRCNFCFKRASERRVHCCQFLLINETGKLTGKKP
jgi:hypothetical protein